MMETVPGGGDGIVIACPVCHSIDLDGCNLCRPQRHAIVSDLIPFEALDDPLVMTEISRYDRIVSSGVYRGYAETNPKGRAGAMKSILVEHGIDSFVEVGPGFGDLLLATNEMGRVAVDLSMRLLQCIHERCPEVRCIRGLAEWLPIDRTPALVSDGTFQVMAHKERFLCEAARACRKLLVFSVGFKHNYPRRPQQGFDVRRPDELEVLQRFLEELGFKVDIRWFSTVTEKWVCAYSGHGVNHADFLYVVATK